MIFHSRFSTNTAPAWERAQPFRHLCHNGEINTIQGNEHRMLARGVLGTEAVGLGPEELFRPVLDPDDSDSGKLDAALELLLRGGRDVRHVVSMLIPEAWEGVRDLDPDVRDYFRYHASITEPWDGPAGADLHRRPARRRRRSTATGCGRCAGSAATTGSSSAAPRPARCPLAGRGADHARPARAGRDALRRPRRPGGSDRGRTTPTVKGCSPSARAYGEWARDGLLPFDAGAAIEMPPDADDLVAEQVVVRVQPRGDRHGAQAHGHRREGADVLDG